VPDFVFLGEVMAVAVLVSQPCEFVADEQVGFGEEDLH